MSVVGSINKWNPLVPWYVKRMNPRKKELVDYAFKNFKIRNFIDLGGVWNVDGAYAFYILEKYRADSAVVVDFLAQNIDRKTPNLTLVKGDFGQEETIGKLHKVDAILMFDILLHQVKPDWNQILEIYSALSDYILIFNPQYDVPKTTRLLDLGEKGYFANVPHGQETSPYNGLFGRLDEIEIVTGKKWRDSPTIWQWGITNKDLIAKMESLSFKLEYLRNWGRFGNLKSFDSYAFLFRRQSVA